MTKSSILSQLYVHHYTLKYEAQGFASFPNIQGPRIRSQLGKCLYQIHSSLDKENRNLFQLIMGNTIEIDHPNYHKFKDGGVPRGYILQIPEKINPINKGEVFEWSLVLVGYLNQYVEEMIPALIQIGIDGLGINKQEFHLQSIIENGANSQRNTIYYINSLEINKPLLPIYIHDFAKLQFKKTTLQLNILSRTQMKEKELHPSQFDFLSIVENLSERAKDLAMIYCNQAEENLSSYIEANKLVVATQHINLKKPQDFIFHSNSQKNQCL